MKAKLNTLRKKDKLKSKTLIDAVLSKGLSLRSGNVHLRYWCVVSPSVEVQVAVSVSKRFMPLAVDRNRVKRQMREVYRVRRHTLAERCSEKGQSLYLFLSYKSSQKPNFDDLEQSMNTLFQALSSRLFVDVEKPC